MPIIRFLKDAAIAATVAEACKSYGTQGYFGEMRGKTGDSRVKIVAGP
jgi:hypothetical protein